MFFVVAFSDEAGTKRQIVMVTCSLCYFGRRRLGLRCTEGKAFVLCNFTPREKTLLTLARCAGVEGLSPTSVSHAPPAKAFLSASK